MFDNGFANREEMGCQASNIGVSEQEMRNTFLVITEKMVKIGVHLLKSSVRLFWTTLYYYKQDYDYYDLVFLHEALLADVAERRRQDAVRRGLAAERFADDHEAVPDDHHLIDLLDLLKERLRALEVHRGTVLAHGRVHHVVVRFRQVDAGEEAVSYTHLTLPTNREV